jgi:epoxyqueuosine reductase QueG
VGDAKSIIVLGIQYEPSTVATVLHPHLAGMRDYTPEQIADPYSIEQPPEARRFFLFDERTMLLQEMTHISYRIARYLRLNGWRSFHVPVVKQDLSRRRPPFQHMPAMYLAGMGTLGLNCCIITPEVGPRALFTTIITNAPLPAGEPMKDEVCTKCGLCVEKCPKGIIDGQGWKNVQACDCCRTCIAICPVGEDAKLIRSYPG